MSATTYGGEYEWPTDRRGIVGVHAPECGIRDGERCSCGPLGYRAAVRDADTGERLVSPLLASEAAAGSWQRTRTPSTTNGHRRARPERTASRASARIADVTEQFLAAATDGRARDPSGRRYGGEALDELRVALRGHVAEELGDLPLTALRGWQVQGFVNELADSGLSPLRLRGIVAALRGLLQYAREQGIVQANPVNGVTVPDGIDRAPRPFTTTDQLRAVAPPEPQQWIPDQALWQLLKVVSVVFILIAIVLAAESI
jgi:hypothetical protein